MKISTMRIIFSFYSMYIFFGYKNQKTSDIE